MKNIIMIAGGVFFDSPNRGCRALAYGMLDFLSSSIDLSSFEIIYPGYCIRRKYPDNTRTISYKGKRYKITNRYYWLHEIILCCILKKVFPKFCKLGTFGQDIDKVHSLYNINGGDSFSDIYGVKQWLTNIYPNIIAAFFNFKSILLPQTIGPFKNKLIKHFSNIIIKKTNTIFVRDNNYNDQLYNLEKPFKQVCDISKLMPPNCFIGANVCTGKIGINISGLCYYNNFKSLSNHFNNYIDLLKALAKHFLDKNLEIVLIPHTYNFNNPNKFDDDLEASKDFLENFFPDNNNIIVLDRDLDAPELKFAISKCDFFIGTRMHSCFAAIFTNTPIYGLSYSYKFSAAFNEANIEHCYSNIVNISRQQISDVIFKVSHSYDNRDRIKKKLQNYNTSELISL